MTGQTSTSMPALAVAVLVFLFVVTPLMVAATIVAGRWSRARRARLDRARTLQILEQMAARQQRGRAFIVITCVSCQHTIKTADLDVLDTGRCADCRPAPVALAGGATR